MPLVRCPPTPRSNRAPRADHRGRRAADAAGRGGVLGRGGDRARGVRGDTAASLLHLLVRWSRCWPWARCRTRSASRSARGRSGCSDWLESRRSETGLQSRIRGRSQLSASLRAGSHPAGRGAGPPGSIARDSRPLRGFRAFCRSGRRATCGGLRAAARLCPNVLACPVRQDLRTTTIVNATALTVTASLVLHGLTARPLTERYARALRRRPRPASIETARTSVRIPSAGHRWPRATAAR